MGKFFSGLFDELMLYARQVAWWSATPKRREKVGKTEKEIVLPNRAKQAQDKGGDPYYPRKLLFSSVVELMRLVTLGLRPSLPRARWLIGCAPTSHVIAPPPEPPRIPVLPLYAAGNPIYPT